MKVAAGLEHALRITHWGEQQTNTTVRVKMGETKPLVFDFEEMRAWTNRLGMVFVRLPVAGFWVGMAQVTTKQYEEVLGMALHEEQKAKGGRVSMVSCSDAMMFAQKLQKFGLPPDCDAWRFAVPTTRQWLTAVRILGVN